MLFYWSPGFSLEGGKLSAPGRIASVGRCHPPSYRVGATHFLCGNAIGVDTWAAELLIRQKKQHPELFLEIALPFASHNEREFACCAVCQLADWVHVVGNAKCRRAAFYQRDRYLVDHSGLLIAVESLVFGGTARTVQMARAKGIPILRIHSSSS